MERHLRPVPRVIEGMKLAAEGIASAMIDVSDGLSSDLAHICEARGVGARVFAEQLPLSKELLNMKRLKRPALHYALSGGEDYELLFTVPPDRMRKLKALRIGASEIGVIEPGGKIMLSTKNGKEALLPPSGYDHFRGASRTTGSRG